MECLRYVEIIFLCSIEILFSKPYSHLHSENVLKKFKITNTRWIRKRLKCCQNTIFFKSFEYANNINYMSMISLLLTISQAHPLSLRGHSNNT